jgi:hypothetical protein
MCGRPITASTYRVKPAYIPNGTDRGNNSFNLAGFSRKLLPHGVNFII